MTKKRLLEFLLLMVVFSVVFAFWYGAWSWIDINVTAPPNSQTETDAAVRGQFGDKFGAINALFSGFAFAGIIFTILLQRRDLDETKKAMSHERFDNTFFQLLRTHLETAEKVIVRGGFSGRQAFEVFNEHFKSADPDFHAFCALQKITRNQVREIVDTSEISRSKYPTLDEADVANLMEVRNKGVGALNNFLDDSEDLHENKIVQAYAKSCAEYIDYFAHYFRNLYHILKYIDDSELISSNEKQRYSRFVRAQLSQAELVALFYNSISDVPLPGRDNLELGYPKMGRLLRRFDMLQNMSERNVIHPLHKKIFEKNYEGAR